MDVIIREIIDVDRRANEIEKSTSKKMQEDKARGDTDMETMRKEMISKAEEDAEKLYESAKAETDAEVRKIKAETKTRCDELDKRFQKIKSDIESRAFSIVINGGDKNE